MSKKFLLDRRNLIKSGFWGSINLGALPALLTMPTANGENANQNRIIFIIVKGGWDQSYLFDSRPKQFTAAGLQQNQTLNTKLETNDQRVRALVGKESAKVSFQRGSTFVHPLAAAFVAKHQQKLAIVRGMVMSSNVDGHEENRRKFLTGSVVEGSPIFFNQIASIVGGFVPFLTSFSPINVGSLSLGLQTSNLPGLTRALAELAKVGGFKESPKLYDQILQEYQRSKDFGKDFNAGTEKLSVALKRQNEFVDQIASIKIGDGAVTQGNSLSLSLGDFTSALSVFYRTDLTRNVVIEVDGGFDTHGANQVQSGLPAYSDLIEFFGGMIEFLEKTPDPVISNRNLLQTTTVVISSEFNRTMINEISKKDSSVFGEGTDHNPQGNLALLFGAGIRGNQVIGSTDGDTLTRSREEVLAQRVGERFGRYNEDVNLVFNRPNGFGKSSAVAGRPYFIKNIASTFNADDYITPASLINTILFRYGVKESQLLKNEGSVNSAKIIEELNV